MASDTLVGKRIDVVKLHPAIGAEIRGVDLTRDIDDATFREIRAAWAQNSVVVFRNQSLTGEQQIGFASKFGKVADRVMPREGANNRPAPNWTNLMMISDRKNPDDTPMGALGHGEMWFHTDKCYVANPHRASFLYGIEIPSVGGNTKFSSLYAAYDKMPDAYKARLDKAFVLQGHQYGAGNRININADLSTIHNYRQPMIVANPDTGRKALYVSRQNTMWIEGIARDESERILDELFDITEDPTHIYEHVWQEGDLLIWDNLACLHARTDWSDNEPRTLRRCTVEGAPLW